jgi:hypothetical protein
MASMFPLPVAVMPVTVVATFHPVIAAAVTAIVILSAQRQTADTEDHQQTKYYQFLHKPGSPFRELNVV